MACQTGKKGGPGSIYLWQTAGALSYRAAAPSRWPGCLAPAATRAIAHGVGGRHSPPCAGRLSPCWVVGCCAVAVRSRRWPECTLQHWTKPGVQRLPDAPGRPGLVRWKALEQSQQMSRSASSMHAAGSSWSLGNSARAGFSATFVDFFSRRVHRRTSTVAVPKSELISCN